MKELFNRWAKLEPEQCKVDSGIVSIKLDPEIWRIDPDDLFHVDCSHLQRKLQLAIAAKPDWRLVLELNHDSANDSVLYYSTLYCPGDFEPFNAFANEAAEAILDVYVQALEAGQEPKQVKASNTAETVSILTEIPEKLHSQIKELIDDGWRWNSVVEIGLTLLLTEAGSDTPLYHDLKASELANRSDQ